MKLVSPELQPSNKRFRYATLFGPWALLFIFVGGVSALFVAVTKLGDGVASGKNDSLFYCDSSGTIRYLYENPYSWQTDVSPYWDTRLFLSVTMGFHGLTFAQAKAIDIGFDLVAGRGSQLLLALATYPILRRSILRSMEIREFSLAFLLPFFLERLSISSLWAMLANMRSRRTKPKTDDQTEQIKYRQARIRIDWRVILVILVGCYVLSLPTITSVMTSYQVRSAPFLPDGLGFVSMAEIESRIPDLLFTDGDVVGLPKDYPIYNDSDSDLLAYQAAYHEVYAYKQDTSAKYHKAMYYANTPDEIKSAFHRIKRSLPAMLNWTDQNDPPSWSQIVRPRDLYYLESNARLNPNTSATESMMVRGGTNYNLTNKPLSFTPNPLPSQGGYAGNLKLAYNNESFPVSRVEETGVCLPDNEYIWGFSSLLLLTFCILTGIVALLLITLHYEAHFNSAADRYKLSLSPYRDLLDFAEEIRAHYGSTEAAQMSAAELDKAMSEDPVAVGLETGDLHRSRRAWGKQRRALRRSVTWSDVRENANVVVGRSPAAADTPAADAETSLMSMGTDAQLQSEMEMAKLPARVASRSTNGS